VRIGTLTADTRRHALGRGLDLACLLAAYYITTVIASGLARVAMFVWPGATSSDILGWPAQYIVLFLIAVTAWNTVGAYLGIYQYGDSYGPRTLSRLVRAALLWAVAIGVAIFLFKLPNVSRFFVLSFVSLGFALMASRDYFERLLGRRNQPTQHRVAIVIGHGAQADWLLEYLRKHFSPKPYATVRRPDAHDGIEPHANGTPYVNNPTCTQELGRLVEIFVATGDMSGDACDAVPQLLKRGFTTHIMPTVFDASIFRLTLSDLGGVPLITLRGGEIDALEAAVKRVIDFMGASLLLTLAAPLMLVLSLLVKISSPGAVIFRQERLGKNGRRIYIYKFRTMRRDAESILKANEQLYKEYVANNYKLPKGRDPRITPVGRVLRQTSLDELPQLINVLKGEMSLVGPRPVVPDEIEQYGDCASLLLSVPPGLTGQWQVSGRSDIADYAQRVRLDMEYLRDQSVATDLRILLQTVPAVLLRQGAH